MKHVRLSLVVLALFSTIACSMDAVAPEALFNGQESAEPQVNRPAGPYFSSTWVGSDTSTDSTSTDSTSVS